MAEPKKPYVPSYMKQGTSGTRADKILRERAAQQRVQLEAATEQEEIGSQYYSSEQQGRLRANPLSRFGTTQAIKREAEKVEAATEKAEEEAAAQAEREQAAREERAKNPYAINTDIQQEESRGSTASPGYQPFTRNVSPSQSQAYKDALEKAKNLPRRPQPATPQDSQELELNERQYGIGSMSLLTDADLKRQDSDIKKAADQKAAEEEAEAKRIQANLRASEEVLRMRGMIDKTNQRASDPLADDPAFGSAGYNISLDYQATLNSSASLEQSATSPDLQDWADEQYEARKQTKEDYKKAEKTEGRRLASLIEEEEKMLGKSSSTVYSKDTSPRFAINTDVQQEQESAERYKTNVSAPLPKDKENAVKQAMLQGTIVEKNKEENPNAPSNPVVPAKNNADEVASTNVDTMAVQTPNKAGETTFETNMLQTASIKDNPYEILDAQQVWQIHKEWAEDVIDAQYNERTMPNPDWNLLAKIRYEFAKPNSIAMKTENYGLSDKDYQKALDLNYVSKWTPNTYKELEESLAEIKKTTSVIQGGDRTSVQTNFNSADDLNNATINTLGGNKYSQSVESPDGGHSHTAINTEERFNLSNLENVKQQIDAEDVKSIAYNIIDKEGQDAGKKPEDFANNPVINGKTVKEWTYSNWEEKPKGVKKGEYPSVIVYKADKNTWAKVDLDSGVVNTVRGFEKPPKGWKVPVSMIKLANNQQLPHPNLPEGFMVLETQKKTPKNKKFNVRGKQGQPGFVVGVTKGQVKFRTRGIRK
tara:strand:- start:1977 stop:4268 length:2292 start_codon:yes stop_codon:yes gene_type:complete